jgi:NAD-dependent deacetylase sirtuin 4
MQDPAAQGVEALAELARSSRVVVLTGAGCSTEWGIPDYRGAGRPVRSSPILHDAFVRRAEVRQRYWARATLGWARFSGARPNGAHLALAALEGEGKVAGIITQNVDRLHHDAGSRRVVELHGALADVRCLDCRGHERRAALQLRLVDANPGWLDPAAPLAPDRHAHLPPEAVGDFTVVGCAACGGPLKPDVVFFGGGVGAETLAAAWGLLEEGQLLLVVGSSLAVWSGFRFVRRAAERGVPVAIINRGPTRADPLARLRLDLPAAAALGELRRLLGVQADACATLEP